MCVLLLYVHFLFNTHGNIKEITSIYITHQIDKNAYTFCIWDYDTLVPSPKNLK